MPRLLLIDDDRNGLEIRRLVFEREGYRVATAADRVSALQAFTDHLPEIVLLDIRLPRAEDGLALIREFRAHAPEVRIVVLTGWTRDLAGRPEAELPDVVLAKPVRAELLMRALSPASAAPE